MKELNCTRCLKIKPIGEFNKDRNLTRGYKYYCRLCNAERMRVYKAKYKATGERIERQRAYQKKYVQTHPERAKAHKLARQHKDELMKDSCEKCGVKEKLHMHHPDATKPLEVITLCVKHHEEAHHGVLI